ncbi:hypothetical protein DOTSEDRAFT_181475 [Dothistroma septosporum NZE10]|uniref:Uncharacterized protein n=1 Tax=Dothistroma septosporum (strain NZE10 / CBS 128990) TaxID=675120 RepID=N1PBQ2_DOTSN|nr:hypothetical protein DOTSEDRAFT_181475 [Dothistroma septosporum NZE10]
MAPTAQYLAQSESKARFFDRLGLDDGNKMHRHLYSLMKAEAVDGWTRMTASREALIPQLQNDSTIEPPYTFGQIDEAAMHAEVWRIYTNARKDTRIMYDLGLDRDGDHDENWIIRWLLWHVFRYRDDRNSSLGRRSGSPTRPSTDSEEPDNGSDDVSISTDRSGSIAAATIASRQVPAAQPQSADADDKTASVSQTRYWDPVRDRFRT